MLSIENVNSESAYICIIITQRLKSWVFCQDPTRIPGYSCWESYQDSATSWKVIQEIEDSYKEIQESRNPVTWR